MKIYKISFAFIFIAFAINHVEAQKWQPGHFTDVKGNVETGFIRINPGARGPIPDEGFIEFKDENKKSNSFKLSASDLRSFVIGKDSFVVAHAPGNENWGKKEFDFVAVAVDEDTKVYASFGGGGKGGGSGFGISPGIGIGTGGYGSGIGGGISIPIGIGGGGGNRNNENTSWYYGANTSTMQHLTNENFEDVMSDIMGDYPEVVEKIHAKVYILANVDRLIIYYKQVKKSIVHSP